MGSTSAKACLRQVVVAIPHSVARPVVVCMERPDPVRFNLEVTGVARSIPGKTKEDGAAEIVYVLQLAADGYRVFDGPRQQSEWLRTGKIKTALDVGAKTVTYTKRRYAESIEENQGWLRWRDAA